jgi:hypothetical protein
MWAQPLSAIEAARTRVRRSPSGAPRHRTRKARAISCVDDVFGYLHPVKISEDARARLLRDNPFAETLKRWLGLGSRCIAAAWVGKDCSADGTIIS